MGIGSVIYKSNSEALCEVTLFSVGLFPGCRCLWIIGMKGAGGGGGWARDFCVVLG